MAGLNCGTVSLIAWPAELGVVAGETGAASLAGLRSLVAHAEEARTEARGRRALVLCTEGATDPLAYERIVGTPSPTDVR